METQTIEVTKEKAEEEYQLYKEALQNKKDQFLSDMKRIYGHMRHGGSVIDVAQAIRDGGIENGHPRLAICRADCRQVILDKYSTRADWNHRLLPDFGIHEGTAVFRYDNRSRGERWTQKQIHPTDELRKGDVLVPNMPWTKLSLKRKNCRVTTLVPVIPVRHIPDGQLTRYHILWEVEEWQSHPVPPRDPMLLRRLTPNVFVVLSSWDLTPLERAVIAGRLT